jgi:hypothetical protein
VRQLDAPAFLLGGDVRCDRGAETVRIDQFRGGCSDDAASRRSTSSLRPLLVETGSDRFHRHRASSRPAQGMQQRAGDESLADFGIGAGDEPGRVESLIFSHFLA